MRVAIFVRGVMPEGGLALASFRLATALVEAGSDASVLYCSGDAPPEMAGLAQRVAADPADPSAPHDLRGALAEMAPDVVVVGSGEIEDLRAASEVAPTLMHAHLHTGVCADTARYWSRLRRPCAVTAGWKCTALRPVLGCNELKETLKPAAVADQKQLLKLLREESIGVLCVSTDQAERYIRHGVPPGRVTTLPNLGIRMGADELAHVAKAIPERWRSAIAFVGRLSKTKGGELLPALHRELSPDDRLRVFGEGYLEPRLASLPPEVLCGHVSQETIAGVLMWAQSFVFPSLWPEPGGIVGVDAQLMGVPLAAFDIGAGRYWPAVERFERADVTGMAGWLSGQQAPTSARNAHAVAAAQEAYWSLVGKKGTRDLASFAEACVFEASHSGPAEKLIEAARAAVMPRDPAGTP